MPLARRPGRREEPQNREPGDLPLTSYNLNGRGDPMLVFFVNDAVTGSPCGNAMMTSALSPEGGSWLKSQNPIASWLARPVGTPAKSVSPALPSLRN